MNAQGKAVERVNGQKNSFVERHLSSGLQSPEQGRGG